MDQAQKVVEHTLPNQLPYPSLNEVNYLAFGEISEEYHNELYGFLEAQGLFNVYKQGKPMVPYIRVRNGNILHEQKIMTEYIRHQIHHPENTHNPRFSEQELEASIIEMRLFIQSQP